MVAMALNLEHFEILRSKINQRLEEIGTRHAHRQIQEFPSKSSEDERNGTKYIKKNTLNPQHFELEKPLG